MTLRALLIVVAVLGLAAATQAQTVWRCGADGRSYSDSPCPEGRPVGMADARSEAQVAQAQQVLARDRQLARQLVAERQQREREALARGPGLAGIGATAAVTPERPSKATNPKPRRQATKPRPAAGAEISRAADRGSRRKPG